MIRKFSLLSMFLFQLTRKIHDQLDFSSSSAHFPFQLHILKDWLIKEIYSKINQ